MRKFQIIAVIVCFFLSMFSCVKDKYDWDECNPRIFITFDWGTGARPDNDELVNVLITGRENGDSTRMQIPPDGQEVRTHTQNYLFLGYTDPGNVTINGTTVSINPDAGGNYPEPDFFAGGFIEQEIIRSLSDQVVTIPMRRQTRPLIIRVILQGPAVGGLSTLTGEISGITMARNINYGFEPVDGQPLHPAEVTGSVAYHMATTDNSVYSDQHNLLGIDGSVDQILDLTVHFTSGRQKELSLNVTTQMTGFHTEHVEEPWVLELTVNLITEIEANIEDWKGNYLSTIGAN